MLQFLRHDDLQNAGFNPALENHRIVQWTCNFEAGESKVEGSISYNYQNSHCYSFKVATPNN